MASFFYSVLHFLVDFACAHSMFRWAAEGLMPDALIYNFCAFALQMPLGALLDSYADRWKKLPGITAVVGVMLTAIGCFTHPAILGLGNAAFHVGGGVDVIREDQGRGWKGRALGIFVAPGALGLYLGGQLAGKVDITVLLILAMAVFALLSLRVPALEPVKGSGIGGNTILPLLCCFLVVILRSYVGLAVVFSWKAGFFMGLLAVLAVVLGKMAGGMASARFGARHTALVSLVLAALCYGFGEQPVFGLSALFFFNMTMPITLYQLWLRFPELPGFSFGLLTFGLFLGFLPVYFGWAIPVGGVIGSLISLLLLAPVVWRDEK